MMTMSEMTTVLDSIIRAATPNRNPGRPVSCPAMLAHGSDFVLDGNRVTVYREAGTCWLRTVEPNIRLRVMPDNSVWIYRHIGHGSFARAHEIEDAWQMTTSLADAVADCHQHGHAWSPDQISPHGAPICSVWRWCLICGCEGLISPVDGRDLIWPANAGLVQLTTGGRLPRLHGPLFGEVRL